MRRRCIGLLLALALAPLILLSPASLATAAASAATDSCGGYFVHPRRFDPGDRSRDTTIVVVEATQDREGGDAPRARTVRCQRH
jgi:hypothetical protein